MTPREREAMIATLDSHPGMAALREALEEARSETVQMIGERVLKSGKAEQDKIQQTHGYFRGATFWLNTRVRSAVESAKREEEQS